MHKDNKNANHSNEKALYETGVGRYEDVNCPMTEETTSDTGIKVSA